MVSNKKKTEFFLYFSDLCHSRSLLIGIFFMQIVDQIAIPSVIQYDLISVVHINVEKMNIKA